MARYEKATVGLFRDIDDANGAIDSLWEEGIDRNSVSVVAQETILPEVNADVSDENLSDGAGAGATVGGILGLLAGISAITVPGIGPLLTVGALATAVGSTAVGAGLGGLVGALIDLGIPDTEAQAYSEAVGQGAVLVSVAGDGINHDKVESIFESNNAEDVKTQTTSS